jgi:stage IV sporulation protein FB
LFIALGIVLFFLGSGFTFVAYFIAMVAHEMAHSAMAAHFGYVLDDVHLMPYGAALSGDTDGMKPREEIWVALAGPLCGFALAVVFTALWWVAPSTYFFTETFVLANFMTSVFNLLPVFPLDGGRVLLAGLSGKMPRGKAVRVMKIGGCIAAGIFMALSAVSVFFKFNVTYSVIAFFMLTGTVTAARASSYLRVKALASRVGRLKEKGLAVREVCVSENATLFALNKLMHGAYFYKVNVMNDRLQVVKTFDETEFERLVMKYDLYDTVGKAIRGGGGGWK